MLSSRPPVGHRQAPSAGLPSGRSQRFGLHVEVRGEGNPVVLLHGQPGSGSDWKAVADDLARDHLVIVPDRPGYGRSGGRATGFAGNAVAIAQLLERLEVGRAVLVGHSWAGGIVLQAALELPDRTAGIVLVSSVAPDEPLGRLDHLLARPLVGTALAAVTLSTAGRLLSWGPARVFAGWKLRGQARQDLAEMARSWRRRSTWNSFAIEQRALVRELPLLASRLSSLDLPATVVAGNVDRVVPVQVSRRLAASIPGALLEEVQGAGHLVPQLHPAVVAGAVRRLAARSFS
ncbi:MAG: alpha/beta fold hydrolase [Acidimicrobiales bacterium]